MASTIPNKQVSADEHDALMRLVKIARGDTGQSRKVANFLLAWWNPDTCGRYDFREGWGVDQEIARDFALVFNMINRCSEYPDTLGYSKEFEGLVRLWRSELKD